MFDPVPDNQDKNFVFTPLSRWMASAIIVVGLLAILTFLGLISWEDFWGVALFGFILIGAIYKYLLLRGW